MCDCMVTIDDFLSFLSIIYWLNEALWLFWSTFLILDPLQSPILCYNLLNLSILISRGRENNSDPFSNGEWNRVYPDCKLAQLVDTKVLWVVVFRNNISILSWQSVLEKMSIEGDTPVTVSFKNTMKYNFQE